MVESLLLFQSPEEHLSAALLLLRAWEDYPGDGVTFTSSRNWLPGETLADYSMKNLVLRHIDSAISGLRDEKVPS